MLLVNNGLISLFNVICCLRLRTYTLPQISGKLKIYIWVLALGLLLSESLPFLGTLLCWWLHPSNSQVGKPWVIFNLPSFFKSVLLPRLLFLFLRKVLWFLLLDSGHHPCVNKYCIFLQGPSDSSFSRLLVYYFQISLHGQGFHYVIFLTPHLS